MKRSNQGPNIWLYSEVCLEPGKRLVVNYFRKRLHLRYLAGFGTCIWYLIFSINIWSSGLFDKIFLEVTITLMITWKFFLNITWWESWVLLANFLNLKPLYLPVEGATFKNTCTTAYSLVICKRQLDNTFFWKCCLYLWFIVPRMVQIWRVFINSLNFYSGNSWNTRGSKS